jgi:hypothetical protein
MTPVKFCDNIRERILKSMEDTMIACGHNAPWYYRAEAALNAIRTHAVVVDRHELEVLRFVYGFSLPDLTEI